MSLRENVLLKGVREIFDNTLKFEMCTLKDGIFNLITYLNPERNDLKWIVYITKRIQLAKTLYLSTYTDIFEKKTPSFV